MRRFTLILVLLSMLSPSAAFAADGIAPGQAFKVPFTVDGESAINRAEVAIKGGKAVMTVYYVKGDSIECMEYAVTRRGEPAPNPSPDPSPEPSPEPVGDLWAIVIEESKDRTPEQAIVLASQEVRDLFKDGRFRVVDAVNDSGKVVLPADDMRTYVQKAIPKRAEWPVLFLVDEAGNGFYTGTLPETVDAMKALVEQNTKEAGNVLPGTSR
jgi:hypothetical protein